MKKHYIYPEIQVSPMWGESVLCESGGFEGNTEGFIEDDLFND